MANRPTPKSKRSAGQKAALKALNARKRDSLGHPLSNENLRIFNAEELQRLIDRAFLPLKEQLRLKRAESRVAEVKEEKRSRYARIRAKPEIYAHNESTRAKTDRQQKQIQRGQIPKPSDVVTHETLKEQVWMFHGAHALETAQELLRLLEKSGAEDSRGYLSMGNGRGKNSTWIGTKFGSPTEVLRSSHHLLLSQSESVVYLLNTPQRQAATSLWVEVKMSTKRNVENAQTTGRKNRKTKT